MDREDAFTVSDIHLLILIFKDTANNSVLFQNALEFCIELTVRKVKMLCDVVSVLFRKHIITLV